MKDHDNNDTKIERRKVLRQVGAVGTIGFGAIAADTATAQEDNKRAIPEGSGPKMDIDSATFRSDLSFRRDVIENSTARLRRQLRQLGYLERESLRDLNLQSELPDSSTIEAGLNEEGYHVSESADDGLLIAISHNSGPRPITFFVRPSLGRAHAVVATETDEIIVTENGEISPDSCEDSTWCDYGACSFCSCQSMFCYMKGKEKTQRCCTSDGGFNCWIVSEGSCGSCSKKPMNCSCCDDE